MPETHLQNTHDKIQKYRMTHDFNAPTRNTVCVWPVQSCLKVSKYQMKMVPEPGNQYDAKAISVCVCH